MSDKLQHPASPTANAPNVVIDFKTIELGAELGKGGFGIVYRATYAHAPAAFKKLQIDALSPETLAEFDGEAQIMTHLRHPNVVQFYGYCTVPRGLVMEYMSKGSLFSVLHDRLEPLDWAVRIRIAQDMAAGLAYLHSVNILHRDIKSLNVLLDEHAKAKLTDFGLSRVKTETKSHATATKTLRDSVGTVQWMAPELFARRAVYTPKSDVYSLGITLWELAARKIPYATDRQEAIPTFVKDGEREDIPADCPPKLAALIKRCWDSNHELRPSAEEIARYMISDAQDIGQASPQAVGIPNAAGYQLVTPVAGGQQGQAGVYQLATPQASPTHTAPASMIFSATAPGTNPHSGAMPAVAAPIKPSAPAVNQAEVITLLTHIVQGKQDEAESMLKLKPELALAPGDIADHAGREFKAMTALQISMCNLDWHMWKMLLKHIPSDVVNEHLQGFSTSPACVRIQVEIQKTWERLLTELQKYIDMPWDEAKCTQQWTNVIGGLQRQMPMHVLQEYCHPNRAFEPCPSFTDDAFPRLDVLNGGGWAEGFSSLGRSVGLLRAGLASSAGGGGRGAGWTGGRRVRASDRQALATLLSTRTTQRDQLVAQLVNPSVKPSKLKP